MEAFNLLRALSLWPNSFVRFWLKVPWFRVFVLFWFLGWVLLLCASAWGLGLADACLRLGAVRYFVSRLFDKFVRFCLCCSFVCMFPHFICHVPLNTYRFCPIRYKCIYIYMYIVWCAHRCILNARFAMLHKFGCCIALDVALHATSLL